MENGSIDRIIENLFYILPLIHKKLLRMDLGGAGGSLTRLHFAILGVLSEGNLTVSELAKTLLIPKPQLTGLIDQLVGMGAVARHPDTKDRRVINLSLTDHGRHMLNEVKAEVKQGIAERLSSLTPEELAELSAALDRLKAIGAKL